MSGAIRWVVAGAAIGAALFGSVGVAVADPPPNCTPADLAGIKAGVSAATSAYLFAHPDVNLTLGEFDSLPKADRQAKLQAYFDTNPQVKADLNSIRQPVVDFYTRCGPQGG